MVQAEGDAQPTPFSFTTRIVSGNTERAPLEFSLVYLFRSNFRAGIEYMPSHGEKNARWVPLANWRLVEADGKRPAVALGMSSAWPSSRVKGEAYSLTLAQAWGQNWSGYASVSFAPKAERSADKWYQPLGLSYRWSKHWQSRLMWDGNKMHPAVSYVSNSDWSASVFLLDGKNPTLSVTYGF